MIRLRSSCAVVVRSAILLLLAILSPRLVQADDAAVPGMSAWKLSGDAKLDGQSLVHSGRKAATAELSDTGADNYILSGTMLLAAENGSLELSLGNAEIPGLHVNWNKKQRQYHVGEKRGAAGELADAAKNPIPFTVTVLGETIDVALGPPADENSSVSAPADRRRVRFSFTNCKLSDLAIKQLPDVPAGLLPLRLDHAANVNLTAKESGNRAGPALDLGSLPKPVASFDNVPFLLIDAPDAQAIDVSQIKRTAQARGKKAARAQGAYAGYDFELPSGQFAALHVLAFSSGRPGTVPQVAVQLAHRSGSEVLAVLQSAGVPALNESKAAAGLAGIPVKLADGTTGYLHHVRIPLACAGDLSGFTPLDVELCSYYETPLDRFLTERIDPPSGAVILAATLERSPVELSYSTAEYGNIFFDTEPAVFSVQLTNRTTKPVSGRLSADCSGPGTIRELNPLFTNWTAAVPYTLAAGESKTVPLDLTPVSRDATAERAALRGVFACTLALTANGQPVYQRHTSFARIAPDTRKALGDSPFGIWCFWGSHSISKDPLKAEKLASIMNKGGWRWTYGGSPAGFKDSPANIGEYLKTKYKVTLNVQCPPGCKRAQIPGVEKLRGAYADPQQFATEVVPWLASARERLIDPSYMVLHENRVNTALLRRFSDYFGGEPYDMPAEEKAKYDLQFKAAVAYAAALRKAAPDAKIVAFNDYPAFIDQHLARGFPDDLFDVIGFEQANFHKQPERQPDWFCLLGAVHELKLIQQKYGYHKPLWTTEALYHSTKPGRFDLHDQAVVSVREAMLALTLGVERMAAANEVADCTGDYSKSQWGTAGMVFRDPEYNPKPSFGMYSWMTQILDQAKPAGKLKHDSTSLHVLDFVRPDGQHVYPLWVVSGQEQVTLKIGAGEPVVYDSYGNKLTAAIADGQLTVNASDAPLYVTRTTIAAVAKIHPIEPAAEGTVLMKSADLAGAKLVAEPSPILAKSGVPNPIQGQFKFSTDHDSLRIELLKDAEPRPLIPRYVEIQLPQPVELPGRPFALDLHVLGNGGWGQIMLQLTDAQGTVWTSCKSGEAEQVGRPYITFDGWNYVRIHLPGQFAADKFRPWMANEDWQSSRDVAEIDAKGRPKPGAPVAVAYPLKLTRIIVTMRPSILYVDEERPVSDHSIQLDRIHVIQSPPGQ